MDYTKGILQRLEAFQLFLHNHPEFREQVTFILVAVPSRSRVETYKLLKHHLDEWVGRINGEQGTIGWTPIWYLNRYFPFNGLTALYNISDIAIITPYRDGMNLIAKEFVASKQSGKAVLILSEMAGAASELQEAIIINPNNIDEMANAIHRAFEMPEGEQIQRTRAMQQKLQSNDVKGWAENFIEILTRNKNLHSSTEKGHPSQIF